MQPPKQKQKQLNNNNNTSSTTTTTTSTSATTSTTCSSYQNTTNEQLIREDANHHHRSPTSILNNNHPNPKRIKIGARASIACETCRRRKVRCSGEYPICTFCASRSLRCDYDGHPDLAKPLSSTPLSTFSPTPSVFSPASTSYQNNPPLSLPSREIQRDAINTFFSHFADESLLTFFHRPTLTRQLDTDTIDPEILLSILTLAGRFCDSLKALHGNFQQTCNFYASQAHSIIRANPDIITLSRLQVHLMLGLHDCTEHEEKRGWMHIGIAIRMAQLLKLCQLDDDLDENHHLQQHIKEIDVIDLEIRRRTFWNCFLIERLFSDGKERPINLKVSDNDLIDQENFEFMIKFPCPDNEFIIGRLVSTAKFNAKPLPPWGPIPKNNVIEHEEADLFGQTMRIAEIWSKVLSYVSRGGRNKDRRCPWLIDSSFGKLDEQLSDWDSKLPNHLQYSESNLVAHSMIGQGKTYGLMHLLYFTSLLYLHRDYIPFLPPLDYHPRNGPIDGEPLWHPNTHNNQRPEPPNPEWWKTSAETCFRSANAITDMVINLSHHACALTNPFAGFAVLTAGTMHIHLWFRPNHAPFIKNVGEYLASDTRILNDLKQTWSISHQWCQALNADYAINSFIQENDNTTVLTTPIHSVRAGLMKIINIQQPNESTQTRWSLVDLVKKTHDIFSEPWPIPSALRIPTRLIGINHKIEQERSNLNNLNRPEHLFDGEPANHFVHQQEIALPDLSTLSDWNAINLLSSWGTSTSNNDINHGNHSSNTTTTTNTNGSGGLDWVV
ncbi:hypothetical protein CROQUDRAFT_45306 [Cronartium quercuum f. sp. fusiforme G11]|uniref:Zn(2)-C6 fungal-type domain-containing protein n=1 Tax=Cronartium quercuum f. sp. fusiforme G11 TaxID=708437 RepID=A0A9P6NFC3_9BASI|nr:hypothetical protein CROQUDRAFT_45306 [Cronartium quercuum f. sp. fusiforme G11]